MARSNNEQRNIALNFITNANETRSQITQLMETIDDTSQEYQDLVQSSRQLEQATESLTNALNNEAGSASNVQDSIQRLQAQQATATRTINNTRNAINNQTVSMRSLTSEITSNGGAMAILDTITGGWATTAKDSIEALALFTAGTNASTVAQRAYTLVVGTSTGALRAFRIALAATGIGAVIVLIGFLVEAWMNLANATDEATEAQKRFDAQAKISKQIADERISDLEFEAEMLREVARERGASVQETRRLETEAYNKRLDELKRQMDDERLSVEDRREAAKKWSQEYNQNLLREQRWRADDAENARNTARATAQNRVKIAKDNSAELKRIEEERIAFSKKIETEYVNWLRVNGAVNPSKGIIAQTEINIEELNRLKDEDLAKSRENTKLTSEQRKNEESAIERYYQVKIDTQNRYLEELTENNKLGEELYAWYTSFMEDDEDSNNIINVDIMRNRVSMFIKMLEDAGQKNYFSKLFNIEGIGEVKDFMRKFRKDTTALLDFKLDKDTSFINKLVGSESDAKTAIERIKQENERILNQQEENALSEARLKEISLADILEIEKFYESERVKNSQEAADAIMEIDRLRLQQQMQAFGAYADLLGATAGLMGEHTAGYKSLAIAQTTIDTYTSAMAAYKGMVQSIPGPVGIAAGAAAAAASVITGISNVKKILAVKTPGGGSSSVSASAPSATATPNVSFVSSSENQITNGVTNAMSNTSNQPMRAYVVASDVTTAQQLERNTIDSNSL